MSTLQIALRLSVSVYACCCYVRLVLHVYYTVGHSTCSGGYDQACWKSRMCVLIHLWVNMYVYIYTESDERDAFHFNFLPFHASLDICTGNSI